MIKDDLELYTQDASLDLNNEIVVKHPDKPLGWHIRDDGIIEVYAGQARIMLDSNTGSIILDGVKIINNAKSIDNYLGNKNAFSIDGYGLNEYWLKQSVLSSDHLDNEYLTGVPKEGQIKVKFSTTFEKHRLFLENQTKENIKNLSDILRLL